MHSVDRPNILIIMADQFQAELLDDRSAVEMPHLRALANQAMRFTHAFTPAPICTPARASFQLGVPVREHGAIGNDRSMPPGARTLADRLNSVGYHTSYVGKWHLDPHSSRGWSDFVDERSLRVADPGNHVMSGRDSPHEGVAPYDTESHIDGRIAQRGVETLQALQLAGRPFAAMVSFHGPHAPYYLPQRWHDAIAPDQIPLPPTFDAEVADRPAVQRQFRCRAWGETWDESKWQRIRAAYFGACRMIDHLTGSLLDMIDPDRTAVLFLADHGENNGHLRMIYKGPMMYDSLVRIPAILRLPGQTERRVDDRLVSLEDFTASVAALAYADMTGIRGNDLTDNSFAGRGYLISEFHEANWVSPVCRQRVAMIRDRKWKYVVTESDPCRELYDMDEIPVEAINRYQDSRLQPHAHRLHRQLANEIEWVSHE